MKRLLTIALAAGFSGGAALASNLNTSVESDGSNNIDVAPGQVVTYEVIGELDDMLNVGLALAGYDLEFSGGPLEPADEPADDTNMAQFKRPNGVTNPDGYGGTIIEGVLRQVGGGANTINNDIDNAPFPLGIVIENIAHPGSPEVLVTGTLTIPEDAVENDVFTLNLTNLFANVIKQGETGEPPQNFWKTEAAGVGTNTDLTMTVVVAAAVNVDLWESVATHTGIGEVGLEIPAAGVFSEPRSPGISKIVVSFSGAIDPATAIEGNIAIEGCDVDGNPLVLSAPVIALSAGDTTMTLTFATALPDLAEYSISLNGFTSANGAAVAGDVSRCILGLLGDASGDGIVDNSDLVGVRFFRGVVFDPANVFHVRSDPNTDGVIDNGDLVAVRFFRGNDARTIACPCP